MISVTDTGVGVAPADRERIFESFQQGAQHPHAGGHRPRPHALPAHRRTHGRSDVARERGRRRQHVRVHRPDRTAEPDGRGCVGAPMTQPRLHRVLVIEDDRQSVDLLTVYLESAGFEVSTAHDGPSGLAAIRRERPVAVILDVRLPRMDGWDVLRAIKADPETSSIPVVVVSVVDERVKGLSLGAAEYLVKPISRDDADGRVGAGTGRAAGRRRWAAATIGASMSDCVSDPRRRGQRAEPQARPRRAVATPGIEVMEARSGEQGVELAAECRPDLILMDLQLPGIDGTEALRQLRASPLDTGGACRRRHGVRDERGPRAGVRVGLRRIRREAVQRS